MEFEVLYIDDYIVAINKPFGYLVHRTDLDEEQDLVLVKILSEHFGKKVYSVHRLDKKTTGVILFSFDREIVKILHREFRKRMVKKTYLAVVKGAPARKGEIESLLTNVSGEIQWALTRFELIEKIDTSNSIPPKFPANHYSLLKLFPYAGRMHQLRKHLASIYHPIIGDRTHGSLKQNAFFYDHFDFNEMLLHASNISFLHPVNGEVVSLSAKLGDEFLRMLYVIGFDHDNTKDIVFF